MVIQSPRALQRILWRPGELGLARAYISGDLDFEGDLTHGLRHVSGKPSGDAPSRGTALGPGGLARGRGRQAQLTILGPPPARARLPSSASAAACRTAAPATGP